MTGRWHAPLDPECPTALRFLDSLFDDPLTEAYGAPVDDIVEGFERKHRKSCARCQAFGAANIEVLT